MEKQPIEIRNTLKRSAFRRKRRLDIAANAVDDDPYNDNARVPETLPQVQVTGSTQSLPSQSSSSSSQPGVMVTSTKSCSVAVRRDDPPPPGTKSTGVHQDRFDVGDAGEGASSTS